jgi:ABC-type multidrug transport system fused ATPase/permease subunit
MSDPAEANPTKGVFKRLLLMLRPHWGTIAVAVLMMILSTPGDLFPAMTWMYVVDHLIMQHPTKSTRALGFFFSFHNHIQKPLYLLLSSVIWMFAVYLLAEALGTLSTFLMSIVAQKFTLMMRNLVYHKLQCQSLAYLQRQRIGDLMSRAMGDVDEVQSFLVNGIDQILGEGLLWIATVILVMLLDWKVATCSLAPLIIVYFLLRVFNRKVRPIYKAARDAAGNVSTRLQENLSGIVVIKIFGREKQEADRFRGETQNYYGEQIRSIKARSIYFPFARMVGFFSNVFMIGIGGYSILTGGGFTLGDLVAFRAYWWRLFGPLQTLARVNDMIQRARAAGIRVFEVIDAPDELPDAVDAKAIQSIQGNIELRNVSFSYGQELSRDSHGGTSSPTVLHDVSVKIEPGQTVALCGPSGSGKSTILNLLLRFYDPTIGQVMLDGVDLRSIQRESLRRHFALVQQETFLFNDSIIDNIRYGHSEAAMQQVIEAAQAANAHEFISKLPNGYDTKVGERGVRLSGGQKQRISIARAFLANPSILLLDEPTSSVEPDSEAAIISALDRLMLGRTTVLTSHRPSLINQSDVVYVIEDGRVVDSGPPKEVRSRNSWLARFLSSPEIPDEIFPPISMIRGQGQPE